MTEAYLCSKLQSFVDETTKLPAAVIKITLGKLSKEAPSFPTGLECPTISNWWTTRLLLEQRFPARQIVLVVDELTRTTDGLRSEYHRARLPRTFCYSSRTALVLSGLASTPPFPRRQMLKNFLDDCLRTWGRVIKSVANNDDDSQPPSHLNHKLQTLVGPPSHFFF